MDALVRQERALGTIHVVLRLYPIDGEMFEHPVRHPVSAIVAQNEIVEGAHAVQTRKAVLHDLRDAAD